MGQALSGIDTDSVRFIQELAGDAGGADAVTRVVRAVTELYPPEQWPALLRMPTTDSDEKWCLHAARELERFVVTEPRVPIALSLHPDRYTNLLVQFPETRAVALLREGFVELRGVSGNQLEQRLRVAGVEPLPAPAILERLTEAGLPEELADAFVKGARSVRNPTPEDIASDFRSLQEQFLFEQLELMPQTAGLFRPNSPLGFRQGQQTAEGDLVAESLKLVIDVDGGYFHLTPEQYRCDRRKDWVYQQHGYLVLRFLADDVVLDFEVVLNTILDAVAFRRTSAQTTGAV